MLGAELARAHAPTAGFAAGSITEIFACMSAGSTPAGAHRANAASTPMSAISTLRKPCVGGAPDVLEARRRPAPARARPARATPPAGARAVADVSQPAFGRANRLTSTRRRGRGARHLVELGVGEQEDAAPLRDAVDRARRAAPPPRAPPRGSAAPRCSGSRRGTARRRGTAWPSRAARSDRRAAGRSSGGSRGSRSSCLRLLEQSLPPIEQRLELGARRAVRGQRSMSSQPSSASLRSSSATVAS